MSAENDSALLVKRLDVEMPAYDLPAYFRSKLFNAPYSSNPLIAAAGPLFSLLERLCISASLPEIDTTRMNIDHELSAFISHLQAAKYAKDSISISRYLMSAVIDEIMGRSYLRVYGENIDFPAFTPLNADALAPGKAFFEIITYIKERPSQYLDIIELSYYCLIIGFEGEYYQKNEGRSQLDHLLEELYLIIQKNRVNKPCLLKSEQNDSVERPKNRKPVYLSVVLALSLATLSLFASEFLLEKKVDRLIDTHLTESQ